MPIKRTKNNTITSNCLDILPYLKTVSLSCGKLCRLSHWDFFDTCQVNTQDTPYSWLKHLFQGKRKGKDIMLFSLNILQVFEINIILFNSAFSNRSHHVGYGQVDLTTYQPVSYTHLTLPTILLV